jgi:hypothetical protein
MAAAPAASTPKPGRRVSPVAVVAANATWAKSLKNGGGVPLHRHNADHGVTNAVDEIRAIVTFAAGGGLKLDVVPTRLIKAASERERLDAIKARKFEFRIYQAKVMVAALKMQMKRKTGRSNSKKFAVMAWRIEQLLLIATNLSRKVDLLLDSDKYDRWVRYHTERHAAAGRARTNGSYERLRSEWKKVSSKKPMTPTELGRRKAAKMLRGIDLEARTHANLKKRDRRRWARAGIALGAAIQGGTTTSPMAFGATEFANTVSTMVVEKLLFALTRRSIPE